MLNVIDSPQESYFTISYIIENDIITITIDDKTEVFDFTGFPEGVLDSISPLILPVNPIESAEKTGDVITIVLRRFYNESEKSLFEVSYVG